MTRWILAAVAAVTIAGRTGQADVTVTASPAAVTVYVPVGATLLIDGVKTRQMTAVRQFVSPPLPVGRRFVYTLTAAFTSDGRPTARRAEVEVWAGASVAVDMMEAADVAPPAPPPAPVYQWQRADPGK
jgi:uncharacterized protein (TIGR03000 family)